MADVRHSKCRVRKGVWVRIPPPASLGRRKPAGKGANRCLCGPWPVMGGPDPHKSSAWRIARQQHGLITRAQLLELGYTRHAIRHRVSTGRLHPIHRGVFVVGRPELDMPGRCMAAVLASGPESMVSHQTAAELWGVRPPRGGPVEISVRRRPIEPFTASVFTAAVRSTRANCKDGSASRSRARSERWSTLRRDSNPDRSKPQSTKQTRSISSIRKHFAWDSMGCAGNAGFLRCAGSSTDAHSGSPTPNSSGSSSGWSAPSGCLHPGLAYG